MELTQEALIQMILSNTFIPPYIIAIDGRCGSGKTTLSKEIRNRYKCNVVHMDDFYLPFSQRTDEIMARLGGNIDFERLLNEIILPLYEGKVAIYKPYNVHQNTYLPSITLDPNVLTVLEGSYSCHPNLRQYLNLCIFMDISKELQLERIEKRNPMKLEAFRTMWIPREEYYFDTCAIRENSDYIIMNR